MTNFKMKATLAALLLAGSMLPAFAQETLKIGAIGSLSGGGTAWGLAIQRGAELAVDEVNKAGGLKVGDKTYKVELLMRDDQYTGQGGKTAAERLVFQDKVKFIVGPIGSNPVLSTVQVTTPRESVADVERLRAGNSEERPQGVIQFPLHADERRVRTQHDEMGEGQPEAQEGRHPRAE